MSQPVWIWVNLSYACYGIAVQGGRVVDAAPIARWMVGKDSRYCADWLRAKGATWVVLR